MLLPVRTSASGQSRRLPLEQIHARNVLGENLDLLLEQHRFSTALELQFRCGMVRFDPESADFPRRKRNGRVVPALKHDSDRVHSGRERGLVSGDLTRLVLNIGQVFERGDEVVSIFRQFHPIASFGTMAMLKKLRRDVVTRCQRRAYRRLDEVTYRT